jgi:hypothetical protein
MERMTQGNSIISAMPRSSGSRLVDVPWQIWIVVAFLVFEGITGNLPLIFRYPIAIGWLAFKCFAIAGLLLRWRPVFVILIFFALLHVLAFSLSAPLTACLNLMLAALTASAFRFYFPNARFEDYRSGFGYDAHGLESFNAGDFDGALTSWQMALLHDPRNVTVREAILTLYTNRGEFDKAWETVRECERLELRMRPELIERLCRDSNQPGPSSPPLQ